MENLNQFSENGNWDYNNLILDAVTEADAIVLLKEWVEFKNLDWENFSKVLRSPLWVFDSRLILNSKEAEKYGINVWKVGNGIF